MSDFYSKFTPEERAWAEDIGRHFDDDRAKRMYVDVAYGWLEAKRGDNLLERFAKPRAAFARYNIDLGRDIYSKLTQDPDAAYIYILELSKGPLLDDKFKTKVETPVSTDEDTYKRDWKEYDLSLRKRRGNP